MVHFGCTNLQELRAKYVMEVSFKYAKEAYTYHLCKLQMEIYRCNTFMPINLYKGQIQCTEASK